MVRIRDLFMPIVWASPRSPRLCGSLQESEIDSSSPEAAGQEDEYSIELQTAGKHG
jgi:hypothetical protein